MTADEYLLDTAIVRAFIGDVRRAMRAARSPAEACANIEPRFAELLADADWLPHTYQQPAHESGMGGGIGQWLLYRAGDGSLSLFSLVVPPGAQTPDPESDPLADVFLPEPAWHRHFQRSLGVTPAEYVRRLSG